MARMQPKPSLHQELLEQAVGGAFRHAGWKVVSRPRIEDVRPDRLVRRGDRQYAVAIKSSSAPRRDRLVPLLAQAILEARAGASNADVSPRPQPLAIVGGRGLSGSLVGDLRSFAARVAPDVSIGIIDLDGSRHFVGPDLEELNSSAVRLPRRIWLPSLAPQLHLFSDLNRWMLKIVLAPAIPEHLLNAPRERLANVSELARVAGVSPMSAFRCVRLLKDAGFVDEPSPLLRLARVEALLDRWRAESLKLVPELPMHWIIPGNRDSQLSEAVLAYSMNWESARSPVRSRQAGRPLPRVCLGLFAAADALGFGFVQGVAPHLYLERPDPLALERLGLAPARPGQRIDVFIRIPAFRESIFRAAVQRDGIPVCDVIQVWLDVADHPSRGASQAKELRRVLDAAWKRAPR